MIGNDQPFVSIWFLATQTLCNFRLRWIGSMSLVFLNAIPCFLTWYPCRSSHHARVPVPGPAQRQGHGTGRGGWDTEGVGGAQTVPGGLVPLSPDVSRHAHSTWHRYTAGLRVDDAGRERRLLHAVCGRHLLWVAVCFATARHTTRYPFRPVSMLLTWYLKSASVTGIPDRLR